MLSITCGLNSICRLEGITQPDLYDMRDKCADKKWPRFADQMISALSSMFRQAVKRGKMPFNPCTGMDDAHKADPNANREWFTRSGNSPARTRRWKC